jgi:hypothetical protein
MDHKHTCLEALSPISNGVLLLFSAKSSFLKSFPGITLAGEGLNCKGDGGERSAICIDEGRVF